MRETTSAKQGGHLNMFRVFEVFRDHSPNTLNTSHFTDACNTEARADEDRIRI
jgi:hypothetical protein